MLAYIASPLFTPLEREWNERIRAHISEYLDVYLPQEDGELLFDLVKSGVPVAEAKQNIFATDIMAIKHCDLLIIVLDGRTIDEGACFELGYAFALGKRCIALKTDVRTLLPIGGNPMIECALYKIFHCLDDLASFVKTTSLDSKVDGQCHQKNVL